MACMALRDDNKISFYADYMLVEDSEIKPPLPNQEMLDIEIDTDLVYFFIKFKARDSGLNALEESGDLKLYKSKIAWRNNLRFDSFQVAKSV